MMSMYSLRYFAGKGSTVHCLIRTKSTYIMPSIFLMNASSTGFPFLRMICLMTTPRSWE